VYQAFTLPYRSSKQLQKQTCFFGYESAPCSSKYRQEQSRVSKRILNTPEGFSVHTVTLVYLSSYFCSLTEVSVLHSLVVDPCNNMKCTCSIAHRLWWRSTQQTKNFEVPSQMQTSLDVSVLYFQFAPMEMKHFSSWQEYSMKWGSQNLFCTLPMK
jgi:hypothetical protein